MSCPRRCPRPTAGAGGVPCRRRGGSWGRSWPSWRAARAQGVRRASGGCLAPLGRFGAAWRAGIAPRLSRGLDAGGARRPRRVVVGGGASAPPRPRRFMNSDGKILASKQKPGPRRSVTSRRVHRAHRGGWGPGSRDSGASPDRSGARRCTEAPGSEPSERRAPELPSARPRGLPGRRHGRGHACARAQDASTRTASRAQAITARCAHYPGPRPTGRLPVGAARVGEGEGGWVLAGRGCAHNARVMVSRADQHPGRLTRPGPTPPGTERPAPGEPSGAQGEARAGG